MMWRLAGSTPSASAGSDAVARLSLIHIFFQSPAEALVQDGDGRIVGVVVREDYGAEKYIHAERAVILTAGGFCNNKALLERYIPTAAMGCASSYLTAGETGECFRMGLGAVSYTHLDVYKRQAFLRARSTIRPELRGEEGKRRAGKAPSGREARRSSFEEDVYKRQIHVISDSVGLTAQAVARAAAAQFGVTNPVIEVLPKVCTFEEIKEFIDEHSAVHKRNTGDGRMLVFYTLVDRDLSRQLAEYAGGRDDIVAVDLVTDAIGAIAHMTGKQPSTKPGGLHVADQ